MLLIQLSCQTDFIDFKENSSKYAQLFGLLTTYCTVGLLKKKHSAYLVGTVLKMLYFTGD